MNNVTSDFQIGISYTTDIPEEMVAGFESAIAITGLDIKSEAREVDSYAGVEWLVPTAVIVFIGKSYFDGFLKEMGKEHYHLFKKYIVTLWEHFFGQDRAVKYNRVSTKGKILSLDKYSPIFSIMTDLLPGYRIKYLLQDDISQAEYQNAIEEFFSFLEELDFGVLNKNIKGQLENARSLGGIILLTYEEGALKVLNPVSRNE
ncbi:MAG: hypothetical protein GXP22_01000 [Gammaproteobacteria bacterium]|nr:hypothetical protein [Gammaproteobacteria bacterium]